VHGLGLHMHLLLIRCLLESEVLAQCSVPEDEDGLGPEGIFSLDDVLGEVLSLVGDLSPHVVDEEWLREIVFVVGVGHRLEVEGHGGAALDITDLVAASRRVGARVEELGNVLAVLREERVGTVLLPLLVVVEHVVGLGREHSSQLLVSEDRIENVNLINRGLSTLVSDAGSGDQSGGDEMNFPNGGVGEQHERESHVGNEGTGPHVVGAVDAGENLVKVVSAAHSPFPVVVAD
jgi:hypothetical protein